MKKIIVLVLLVFSLFPVFSMRIVSLAPNVTEVVCALDSFDNLVGRTDYCNNPEKVKTIQSIGSLYEPNIEKIITLEPDIVIASSIVSPAVLEKISDAGIKCSRINEEHNGMDGTFLFISSIGELIGKKEQSQALINKQKNELKLLKDNLPENRKKCVLLISWGDAGDYGATGDTFLSDILECAGGINIAKDCSFWSVPREVLINEDPDCIFLTADKNQDFEKIRKSFIKSFPYSKLKACKTNQVFVIDSDSSQRQGVYTIDVIKEIFTCLYPELS